MAKETIKKQFLFFEMEKFLPYWADAKKIAAKSPDDDSPATKGCNKIAKAMSAKDSAAKKHMTILQWPIAFDRQPSQPMPQAS